MFETNNSNVRQQESSSKISLKDKKGYDGTTNCSTTAGHLEQQIEESECSKVSAHRSNIIPETKGNQQYVISYKDTNDIKEEKNIEHSQKYKSAIHERSLSNTNNLEEIDRKNSETKKENRQTPNNDIEKPNAGKENRQMQNTVTETPGTKTGKGDTSTKQNNVFPESNKNSNWITRIKRCIQIIALGLVVCGIYVIAKGDFSNDNNNIDEDYMVTILENMSEDDIRQIVE
jgi:hypothetical protein